uniref:Uncharacterized protein n=1 Tax=Anguilla anguilla TaxID=7936 RepID=A0A0E9RM05_ANGAN
MSPMSFITAVSQLRLHARSHWFCTTDSKQRLHVVSMIDGMSSVKKKKTDISGGAL